MDVVFAGAPALGKTRDILRARMVYFKQPGCSGDLSEEIIQAVFSPEIRILASIWIDGGMSSEPVALPNESTMNLAGFRWPPTPISVMDFQLSRGEQAASEGRIAGKSNTRQRSAQPTQKRRDNPTEGFTPPEAALTWEHDDPLKLFSPRSRFCFVPGDDSAGRGAGRSAGRSF